MRRRSGAGHDKTSANTLQIFFCIDIDTNQLIAFTIASSALSVPQVTPGLLGMVEDILMPCELEPNKALCIDYIDRWEIEEFFNINQVLGWKRAGTQNLNIRYGKMSLALVGNSVMNQLRKRLDAPYEKMEAHHLSKQLFQGLDGDLRVKDDTLVVTYYNAPKQIQNSYEDIIQKLEQEGISPKIPWLYDLKLSFRFK